MNYERHLVHMKILVFVTLILFAQLTSAAETSLLECRKINPVEERVACYDAIADQHLPVANQETTLPPETEKEVIVMPTQAEPSITEQSIQAEATADTTVSDAVAPSGTALFGKSQAESKRIVEETYEIEPLNQITAKVTSVSKSSLKKLTITLDNGQTWRQLDYSPFRLRKGETVIIRAASLGSFLLRKESGSGSIRVSRTD